MDNSRKKELILISSLVFLILVSSLYLDILKSKENNKINVAQTINKPKKLSSYEQEKEEKRKIKELLYKKSIDSLNEDTLENEVSFSDVEDSGFYDEDYAYLNNMNFKHLNESDWKIKYDDEKYTSIIGLDVSEFNGYIDFYKLKDQGYEFVMMRVGWRGSTEGGIYKDKNFEDYYKEAKDAGLKLGYYFFSQAINDEEAKKEAEFVVEQINDKQCDMFVCYDMETSINKDGRSDRLPYKQYISNALVFSNYIKENGYEPMVYTNLDWAKTKYDCSVFNDNNIAIWLAQYNGYPSVKFKYVMWQYTASASVNGVSPKGMTDLNLMLIEK